MLRVFGFDALVCGHCGGVPLPLTVAGWTSPYAVPGFAHAWVLDPWDSGIGSVGLEDIAPCEFAGDEVGLFGGCAELAAELEGAVGADEVVVATQQGHGLVERGVRVSGAVRAAMEAGERPANREIQTLNDGGVWLLGAPVLAQAVSTPPYRKPARASIAASTVDAH